MFVRLPSGAALNLDRVALVVVKRKDGHGPAVANVYVPGLEAPYAAFQDEDAEALATWTTMLAELTP
jgi:hypothetical protein